MTLDDVFAAETPAERAARQRALRLHSTGARTVAQDIALLSMTPAVRDDMIARLWATGTMDTVGIAAACGCRQSVVERVLHRQREARR